MGTLFLPAEPFPHNGVTSETSKKGNQPHLSRLLPLALPADKLIKILQEFCISLLQA